MSEQRYFHSYPLWLLWRHHRREIPAILWERRRAERKARLSLRREYRRVLNAMNDGKLPRRGVSIRIAAFREALALRICPQLAPAGAYARHLTGIVQRDLQARSFSNEPEPKPESPRHEQWPVKADTTTSGDIEIFVYADGALIYPPATVMEDESPCIDLDAAGLRAFAAELLWAAERLEARFTPETKAP